MMSGDLPTTIELLQSFPEFKIWQDYLNPDPIMNEQFGFRLTYFKNGFPMSALIAEPPSGDFLFQRFYSEQPRFYDFNKNEKNNGYFSGVISSEFGINETKNLQPCYTYDIEKKELTVHGIENNVRFELYMGTKISATSGLTQIIYVKNKLIEFPIVLEWKRCMDNNFNLLPDLFENNLVNVNVWNYPKDNPEEFVKFNIEDKSYRQRLKYLKRFITENWNKLNINEFDIKNEHKIFKLICEDPLFYKLNEPFKTHINDLTILIERETIEENNVTYSLLINDYLYFVLRTEEIRR